MGRFKDWIKKMSLKDKIKNICIIVLSGSLGVVVFILSVISGRNRNTSTIDRGGFDRNYSTTKSTLDRIGQRIDSANSRIKHLKDGLQSGSESISDVINDPSKRKK